MNLTEHFSEAEFLRSATAEEYKIKNTWERPEHRDNAIKLCRELEKEPLNLFTIIFEQSM